MFLENMILGGNMKVIMIGLVLIFVGCSQNKSGCGGFMMVGGSPVYWDNIPIKIHPIVYPEEVAAAVDIWNDTLGYSMFVISDKGVDVIEDSSLINTKKNAITYSNFQFNRFTYSVIKVNPDVKVDEISLMVHELGHVLGLDHTNHTVMQPTLGENIIRDRIEPEIIQEVNCVYRNKRSN